MHGSPPSSPTPREGRISPTLMFQRKATIIIETMKKKAEKIAERVSYEEDRQKGTGIHRSLDAMRRSSAETLERIRANETQRRLTVDGNIRGAHNSGSIPLLFPKDFLFSEFHGNFKKMWTLSVLLLVVYSAIIIPLELAFPGENFSSDVTSTVVDIIFIFDVVLSFRTTYVDPNGDEVFDKTLIKENYLKTWFPIDLMACFPLELIVMLFSDGKNEAGNIGATILLRLLKFPRLLRMGRIFKYLERMKYAGCWRIFRLVLGLILIAHWTACFFYLLLNNEYYVQGTRSWELYEEDQNSRVGILEQYINALYAALSMLIGEGIDPNTPVQKVFQMAFNILGSMVMAYVIGNMSVILHNDNALSTMFEEKVDEVTNSMRAMGISEKLRDKVLGYYDYLWQRHRLISTKSSFVDDLSPYLRHEVSLNLNLDIIQRCQFFRTMLTGSSLGLNELSREIVDHILVLMVSHLNREVYLPNDIIVQQGEIGNSMFFLNTGIVVVEKMVQMPDNSFESKVSLTLDAGSYFGELALLKPHNRRAASVVATTNCDVRFLKKKDFDKICDDFPQLKTFLEVEAAEKYAPSNGSDHCDAEKVVDAQQTRKNVNIAAKKMLMRRALEKKSGLLMPSDTKSMPSETQGTLKKELQEEQMGSRQMLLNRILKSKRRSSAFASAEKSMKKTDPLTGEEVLKSLIEQIKRREDMVDLLGASLDNLADRLTKIETTTTLKAASASLRSFDQGKQKLKATLKEATSNVQAINILLRSKGKGGGWKLGRRYSM
jgi:CRP-like cAMP-binding protein